mmetsp:Transcript_53656/g.122398  ORF Transcript_53656/g.122398 Transcript_53656/m.122398 type:complete len:1193 (+) Transcript_53656:132-3710(+)
MADAKKDGKSREELTQEVKIDVHDMPPLEGIMSIRAAMQNTFAAPASIEEFMLKGLTTDEADAVRDVVGHENMLTPPPTTPWWILFIEHQTGFFSLLLWAASILCFVSYGLDNSGVDNLYLGIVLAVVVFLTGVFSYYQEASSAAVMAGFKNMIPPQVSAIRDGTKMVIDAKSLVPGDVVLCLTGEKMPADVRICDFTNFKCDQSSLTGEPDAIKKMAQNKDESGKPMEATNLAFFGTMVAEGEAKGFVILTGDDTVMGHIAALATGTEADDTPIAKEIHHFIILISALAIILGVTFFIVSLTIYDVVKSLVFGIGIIVANVPEGLLATVTVSLTLTAKRLAVKKVLVKQLESVETLGSTTCICSDKTGTLTQNRMTVTSCYVNDEVHEVPSSEEGWAQGSEDARKLMVDSTFETLFKIAVLCNSGKFTEADRGKPVTERLCSNGNASDYAFLRMAEAIPSLHEALTTDGDEASTMGGIDKDSEGGRVFWVHELRKRCPCPYPEASVPFDSRWKFMASLCTLESGGGGAGGGGVLFVVVKGAAEVVFSRCSTMLLRGTQVAINSRLEARFQQVCEELGARGERTLGVAFRRLDGPLATGGGGAGGGEAPGGWRGGSPEEANYPLGTAHLASSRRGAEGTAGVANWAGDALCYVGLLGLKDPPREAVPSSVRAARSAGIKVVMVTGDHPTTAAAIAREVGILTGPTGAGASGGGGPGGGQGDEGNSEGAPRECGPTRAIVTGPELETMPDDQLQRVLLMDEVVFARTLPVQKLRIVESARSMGHVVAVTGDGVNDAPSLRRADIGCAMGLTGTEVAKEAADIVLLSDDFSAIVDGIEEGRLIFDNLKKSIAYTLSSNIPEISPFVLFIVARFPLSLTTILILCVDLGTDLIPAISLAWEAPESDLMRRPPRDAQRERLVTWKLVSFSYLQIGVFQALAGLYSFCVVLSDYGWPLSALPNSAHKFEAYPLDEKRRTIAPSCPCGGGRPATGNFLDSQRTVAIRGGSLVEDSGAELSAEDREACDPRDIGIKWDEDWPFGYGCPFGSIKPTQECKFSPTRSPWGRPCYRPSVALRCAQTASLVSIVVVQWADLVVCKTRLLSIVSQGMASNTVLLFGLFTETLLCLALCYLPFMNTAFRTEPIHPVHWFPSMPFAVFIFVYDETRKGLLRRSRRLAAIQGAPRGAVGFVEMYTYY